MDEDLYGMRYFSISSPGVSTSAYGNQGGYREYPGYKCAARELLGMGARSVFEIGCGRGYTLKRLNNLGIRAHGIDISRHCYSTRVTESVALWDATNLPWPFADKEFDICTSMSVMEHIPEDQLDDVIRESIRISERGVHSIAFEFDRPSEIHGNELWIWEDPDKTHVTKHPREWWENKFNEIDPNYDIKIHDFDGNCEILNSTLKLNIGCVFGTFINMLHDGWINIDGGQPLIDKYVDKEKYSFVSHDFSKPLNYKDGSVEMIFLNNVLERLNQGGFELLLKECYRLIRPGGLLRISTVDLTISPYGCGDFSTLELALGRLGFKDIRRCSHFESRNEMMARETYVAFPSINITLEALK